MIRLGTAPEDIAQAARLLSAGRLVAFPTETVYGLGADARDPVAVAAIFRAKRRPADHPVIVHLPSAAALPGWARFVPSEARALAEAFWPGPLTLILERKDSVPDAITGGQETVGLRVPGHPVALALLRAFGSGIAAPSANRFGRISPTRAEHVIDEFGDEVAAVVDGGPCDVGVESTIVDLSGSAPRLLRPGMIPASAIAAVLGETPRPAGEHEGPRASGRLASHYAPVAPVLLASADSLADVVRDGVEAGQRVEVLALRGEEREVDSAHWRRMPPDPRDYARVLYAELRKADANGPDRIVVECPPDAPAWAAVIDRLRRAAA